MNWTACHSRGERFSFECCSGSSPTVGEIVNYENTFLLRYLRGPEGLIVELAERLDRARR